MSLVSLYDEASLWMTPSGVKDGKLYSELPVPVYGPELVTNGDFATDSDWSKTSGVTISGGKALLNIVGGAYTSLSQAFSYTSGRSYVLTAVVQGTSGSNGKQFRFQDRGNNTGGLTISNGTITLDESVQNIKIYWTANSNSDGLVISRASTGDWSFSIDNVSVKEVLSGDGDFTFSRGSNLAATRVGADGLIEKGRENLFLHSNQFDTTWYSALGSGSSITSGHSGYDGSSDAWLISKTTNGGQIYQNQSYSGVSTYSVYAKPSASNWMLLVVSTSTEFQYAYFDISNGSIGTNEFFIDVSITDVGNGWYRCSVVTSGNNITRPRIYPAEGNNNVIGTGSIYIQDAQLEIGLAATDYIESGATTGKAGLLEDEPRLDYSGGVTCPSLLLEPSRTNLITQSEYFESSDWYKQNAIAVNTNSDLSPEGLQNATELDGFDSSDFQSVTQYITLSDGTYTFSVFLKKTTGALNHYPAVAMSSTYKYVIINSSTGTYAESTGTNDNDSVIIESWNEDWWRVILTNTLTAGTHRFAIYPALSSNGTGITTNAAGTNVFYGAQVEQGSYPTSYIPNHSGGTITRGADVLDGAGDSSTFNSTEGVLYAEISALADDGTLRMLNINDGTKNNRVGLQYSSTTNLITAAYDISGAGQATISYTLSDANSFNKIAFKYKQNDFALWVNGVEVGTDTSGNVLPSNTLNNIESQYGDDRFYFYGKVKQVLVFNTALTDSELTELTINGIKEELITAYKKRATTLEEGASERLDTYLQSLEDFIII